MKTTRTRNDRWLAALLLLTIAAGLPGCVTSALGRKMVQAPNRQSPPPRATIPVNAALLAATYAQSWRVHVGPPSVALAVAIIEPGDYQLRYGMSVGSNRHPPDRTRMSINWEPRAAGAPVLVPRGTVVLLHGFLMNRESMLHWALFFAQQGYRAVLVDLRGHGASGGEWITFGAAEGRDLVRVLDELETRGIVSGRVRVLGVSYGAVMALHWAARDARVGSVVALEPFSDPQRAVIEFARAFPGFKSLAERLSDETFAAAMIKAARMGGFAWEDVSVIDAVRQLQIPVLFYHGTRDTWIPPSHSEALVAIAPRGSRLVRLPPDDHLSLAARLDPIAFEVLEWFENGAADPAVVEARPIPAAGP